MCSEPHLFSPAPRQIYKILQHLFLHLQFSLLVYAILAAYGDVIIFAHSSPPYVNVSPLFRSTPLHDSGQASVRPFLPQQLFPALAQKLLCSHVLLHQIIYTGAITPESTDENTADDSLILYNKHKIPTVILYPVTAIHMVCLWSPVSRDVIVDDLCFWFPSSQKELNSCWIRLQVEASLPAQWCESARQCMRHRFSSDPGRPPRASAH